MKRQHEPPQTDDPLDISWGRLSESVKAHGALVPYLDATKPHAHNMLHHGWTVVRNALPPEEVTQLVSMFDEQLRDDGFACQFAKPETCQMAGHMPCHFWGIECCLYALSPAAMQARIDMRAALAEALFNVPAEQLASSFDGVMITHAKYTTKPQIDPAKPRLPIDPKTGAGPGHIDQHKRRDATAESFQAYLALTPACKTDMSTCLAAPANGHTVQSMMDALRAQFPDFYTSSKKFKGDLGPGAEGFQLPIEQRDWLFDNGICKLEKPDMRPGDIIVWSSAIPHCGGTYEGKGLRHPRLGVISGFCPKAIVPPAARDKMAAIVGGAHSTGQQILYPSRHGGDFPSSLRRFTPREKWPKPYRTMEDLRKQLKDQGLRYYRPAGPEMEDALWMQQMRDLLGIDL